MIINQTVSGGGNAPTYYIEKTKDSNNRLIKGTQLINLNGVTNVGDYALYAAYYTSVFPALENVEFNSLVTISGASACSAMFQNGGVKTVSLNSLTTISGTNACNVMFSGCSQLTDANLPSLTTISGITACSSMFQATKLSNIDIHSLTSVTAQMACMSMFSNCKQLTSLNFQSLTTLTGSQCFAYMFQNCTSLTSLSFPALTSTSFGSYTNQFNNMLSGVTGCTVHFPSNLQSVIGSWSDVTAGFGGTNTIVLFDLTATS